MLYRSERLPLLDKFQISSQKHLLVRQCLPQFTPLGHARALPRQIHTPKEKKYAAVVDTVGHY